MASVQKLSETLKLIKFEHTVFAMPFALMGMVAGWGSGGELSWGVVGLIVLAMVFARTTAMAFNRFVDAAIDAKNPRTSDRAIAAGRLSKSFVGMFALVSTALFILVAYFINDLSFYLSPVALAIVLGYSYTKRFTIFTHLILGLALACAPIGGWIAVAGALSVMPVVLGLFVVFWVGGFDVIYACQDYEFDVSHSLYSIPCRFGIRNGLYAARIFHVIALVFLIAFHLISGGGMWFLAGVLFMGIMLFYQNRIVKADDLSRVNTAFFTINGISAIVLLVFFLLDKFA